MNELTTRRGALRSLVQIGMGAAAIPLLGSGNVLAGGTASQCPGADTGIPWVPDVMHPVAAGFQDLGVAEGAPSPVRVWYPTAELGVVGRPAKILDHCTARWPVVLFLHGQQPCPGARPADPEYFKAWTHISAQLARSGYVVLVPAHSQRPAD
jgi:predicted dienelactone hydrolase